MSGARFRTKKKSSLNSLSLSPPPPSPPSSPSFSPVVPVANGPRARIYLVGERLSSGSGITMEKRHRIGQGFENCRTNGAAAGVFAADHRREDEKQKVGATRGQRWPSALRGPLSSLVPIRTTPIPIDKVLRSFHHYPPLFSAWLLSLSLSLSLSLPAEYFIIGQGSRENGAGFSSILPSFLFPSLSPFAGLINAHASCTYGIGPCIVAADDRGLCDRNRRLIAKTYLPFVCSVICVEGKFARFVWRIGFSFGGGSDFEMMRWQGDSEILKRNERSLLFLEYLKLGWFWTKVELTKD